MEFRDFRAALQEHFIKITENIATKLYEVSVDKDEMWNLYLDSFPAGTNEIYRERREYDCSCCRHFIKSFGNVVTIENGKVHTIWELDLGDKVFQVVADALNKYILDHTVTDVYLTKESKIGTEYNYERLENGKVNRYEHLYLELPERLVFNRRETLDTVKGQYRDTRNVFKRSLDEITEESIQTVLELIAQNSLYKGKEWEEVLKEFLRYKKEYKKLSDEEKELYAWENSIKAGMSIGRIRNHSMGTLLVNISEGMDLDLAVKKYEQIVAPANYKRPKAIFTKKMLEDAQKTITELGYMDSLKRRFATLDDITVNNILFVNKDSAKRVSGALDLFAEMEKDVSSNPKKFSKVEEIGIEDFIKNVLPVAKEVEAYFDNTHISNMVSLIAPEVRDSKTMFKWDNNFSWAYTGNMTDSMLKERVKAAGGKVDGDLRFSIQWNDTSEYSGNDLDAHCQEPGGMHIYFGSTARKPGRSKMGGQLDIDITAPICGVPAVENITWPDRSKMKPGVYKFWVHQFANRGGRDGFRAEIEFDGQIHSFDYGKELRNKESVQVAEVTLDKEGKFSIKELLPSTMASKEVWGIKTNQFVPVSVMCYSPNYWDEQTGIGHKHYFFMLKDCVNPESPNGYYNEFLKPELEKHKRVFEALGAKAHVIEVDDQLSGLGFSSTKRAELIVKVKGNTERVMKIKF